MFHSVWGFLVDIQTVVSLHKVHNFLTREDKKSSDVLRVFWLRCIYVDIQVIVMVAKTSFFPILRCGHMISYIPMYGNSVIFFIPFQCFNTQICLYHCLSVPTLYIVIYMCSVLVHVIAVNNKQREMLYLTPVTCNFVHIYLDMTNGARVLKYRVSQLPALYPAVPSHILIFRIYSTVLSRELIDLHHVLLPENLRAHLQLSV